VTLVRPAPQSLLAFFQSFLDGLLRRWTGPAQPSLVLDSLTDLARPKSQLIQENALLRQQLVILQRQVKRPHLNCHDRFFLLVLAGRVANWKQALLIIQPDTLLRWHRQGFRLFWRRRSRAKTNQPKLGRETIELIQRLGQENPLWGAERIRGELLKLGIEVAKRTIQKYLRPMKATLPRGQAWATFLKNHAQDIWACDFLPIIDLWFRTVYLFFIIELGSRRVVHFGVTRHPTEVWVAQQLREATPYGEGSKYLIRDNDAKFGMAFDQVAKATGIEVLRIPFRAPLANATCERFLGSVRRECLNHLLIFSERQLYRVIKEYVEYFNRARPHQGLRQEIPEGVKGEQEVLATGKIIPFPGMPAPREDQQGQERENREGKPRPANGKIIGFPVLGGLHHTYRRVA
jgi:putative transposase